jgi:hypothetical protein
MPLYYRAVARSAFLTAVKRLILLHQPLEDQPEEAVRAARVAREPDVLARAARKQPK